MDLGSSQLARSARFVWRRDVDRPVLVAMKKTGGHMRGLTNLLITSHVMKGICGRGPALFGLFFVSAIPVGLLIVLIDHLHPGGFAPLAWNAVRTFLQGFH